MHSCFGYSAVSTFEQCPYKYRLQWIDKLKTLPSDDAANPLIVGTALHRAIETNLEQAIKEYLASYPIINDLQINEIIKLEATVPKVKRLLCGRLQNEVVVKYDDFIGTIDLLEEDGDGYNLYDFKYANIKNIERYRESRQLHIYKHFFELSTDKKIKNMAYIIVPKTMIRQKKTEDLLRFRKRLQETLSKIEPILIPVEFNSKKVDEYFEIKREIQATKTWEKNETPLCDWCNFKKLCLERKDYMILPISERREIGTPKKRKVWLYGASFSGKTTMLDEAPNPLNLNTDGNIEFVTMPYIKVADEVTVEGRHIKRKFAWEVLKETIDELEKKQNDFQTVIIDLLEDTREMCRLYMYDKLDIQHESDSGYGKGWDIIKTEYLSTIRRFFNLDYENLVVVSHELVSEIKKKNGQTITKIAPNIQEAIANKVAGMVDIVARVVVEDDESRTLNFKSDEYIFGGGRLKGIMETKIPLTWEALIVSYNNLSGSVSKIKDASERINTIEKEEAPKSDVKEEIEKPKARQRRTRKERVED